MDTVLEVTIASHKNAAELGDIWVAVDSFLADWDARYSDTGATSEISKINLRTSPSVAIDTALGKMIADALRYSDTTHGMYDITILPLKNCWGLGYTERNEIMPDADTLAAIVNRIGYRFVHVNATFDTITFDRPDITIDAGGFAKGYGLIRMAALLSSLNIENYLIAAGDILARGRRSDGRPWVIGIMHPRNEGALLGSLPLDSGVIFTSGDYERRWDSNPLVHHIFNPKTGYSCTKNQSLTIWSMSAVEAKFLSTGLFGWPADSILSFVKQRPLEAVIVDSTGKVFITPGWKDVVNLDVK